MTKIKFCGMRRACDIEWANELKPDYIGFIFAEGFRRYIAPEAAAQLTAGLDSSITPVGVFVNSPVMDIAAITKAGIIRAVQLHGQEDNSYIDALRAELKNISIIKAFAVRSREDVEAANASHADLVLLDSGTGTGKVFNHELLRFVERDYILAGGLNPDNIGEVLGCVSPYGVDVSSGIETDGVKDHAKMLRFAETVRST